MKQAVFAGGEQVGSLDMEKDGLFWRFDCRLTKGTGRIHRIYVVNGWQVEYLGIPDSTGRLHTKLPCSHFPDGIHTALATELPRGDWLPWSGEIEGISVTDAFVKHTPEGIRLALSPQETLKFPAWAERMTTEHICNREVAVLPLSEDGNLPMIEKEFGGIEDEAPEEMDGDFADPDLLDDDFADDGFGGDLDEDTGW